MHFQQAPHAVANLASAFLASPWTLPILAARAKKATGRSLRKLVRQLLNWTASPPKYDDLIVYLLQHMSSSLALEVREYFWVSMTMDPRGDAAKSWQVPALTSPKQLTDWLGVSPGQLDWLADIRGLNAAQGEPKLRHYVRRWQPRRRGRFRLIESPKPTLKRIQRKILHDILDRIPPHPAVHGFRAGHSILSYAEPHVGQRIVLRFDLRDFFPTVRPARVHALFRTAGYPHHVARLLTGLCLGRVPLDVWEQRPDPRPTDARLEKLLLGRHLPQGAPSSPALANLCTRRLDLRLHGLAQSLQAVYTRYADDLAFSGGKLLEPASRRFQIAVAVIAAEEGFDLHFQKSRFMRQGVCQQLAGIVVNRQPNIRREVYDELKAILTNCGRHGPHTQNRAGHADFRSHLLGRIAHVRMIHPVRGAKLQALYAKIAW